MTFKMCISFAKFVYCNGIVYEGKFGTKYDVHFA